MGKFSIQQINVCIFYVLLFFFFFFSFFFFSFFFVFPENGFDFPCKLFSDVSRGNKLHKIQSLFSGKKIRKKYFKLSSTEIIIQHAKC